MQNCFSACIFSIIKATSKSDGKLVLALQFSQVIMLSPVVGSTGLQLSRAPPVVRSTYSCLEHPQLSRVPTIIGLPPTVVESISSCREHLQLSRAPSVVQSTSSCQEYKLEEHLELSGVIFVRLGES